MLKGLGIVSADRMLVHGEGRNVIRIGVGALVCR